MVLETQLTVMVRMDSKRKTSGTEQIHRFLRAVQTT